MPEGVSALHFIVCLPLALPDLRETKALKLRAMGGRVSGDVEAGTVHVTRSIIRIMLTASSFS